MTDASSIIHRPSIDALLNVCVREGEKKKKPSLICNKVNFFTAMIHKENSTDLSSGRGPRHNALVCLMRIIFVREAAAAGATAAAAMAAVAAAVGSRRGDSTSTCHTCLSPQCFDVGHIGATDA